MVDGPGSLPDEGQVVERGDNLLVAVRTARMDGQWFGLVGAVKFNREGIKVGRQLGLGLVDGHRVPVDIQLHLAVPVQANGGRPAVVIGMGRQLV